MASAYSPGVVYLAISMLLLLGLVGGSSLLRIQPSYAAYALPLATIALGYFLNYFMAKQGPLTAASVIIVPAVVGFALSFPTLSRSADHQDPHADISRALSTQITGRQIVYSQTSDTFVPLLPHLKIDDPGLMHSFNTVPTQALRTSEQARSFTSNDITFIGLFNRHTLPNTAESDIQDFLFGPNSTRTHFYFLYSSDIPMPGLYSYLSDACVSTGKHEGYRLFSCTADLNSNTTPFSGN